MRIIARLLALTLLLSAFFSTLAFPQCSIPESYTNRATVTEGNLLVTLATDREAYQVGTPVQIWLSFENIGSVPLSIPNPNMITPMQGIFILSASCDSLDAPGCVDTWVYRYPEVIFFFGTPLNLTPGQCSSTERTWDGTSATIPLVPGPYTVFGGMETRFGEFHAPRGGVKLPIEIQASATVPVTLTTWGLVKSRYE